jgi:hypothetical protein
MDKFSVAPVPNRQVVTNVGVQRRRRRRTTPDNCDGDSGNKRRRKTVGSSSMVGAFSASGKENVA